MSASVPARFFSLDVLRGLAALCVVFWHWQHFFFEGTQWVPFEGARQPFYDVAFVLYQKGWLAVDLFFSLSGFIFFWLYAGSINARKISGKTFFVLRFSRLYPLHIATFAFVLLAQSVFWWRHGDFFVYPFNDAYHGVLNIFMAAAWGFERGWSFNAPFWSVSVEILLYALFFGLCLAVRLRTRVLLTLMLAGLVLMPFNALLGRGLFSFFVGGACFGVYRYGQADHRLRPATILTMTAAASLWLAVIAEVRLGWFWPEIQAWLEMVPGMGLYIGANEVTRFGSSLIVTGLLFPLTIIALALAETWRGHLGRRLAMIGNLSYSSYLLHFPLQLMLVLVMAELGVNRSFFYSAASMMLFFGMLIPLAWLSYRFFEAPMQQALRTRLLVRPVERAL